MKSVIQEEKTRITQKLVIENIHRAAQFLHPLSANLSTLSTDDRLETRISITNQISELNVQSADFDEENSDSGETEFFSDHEDNIMGEYLNGSTTLSGEHGGSVPTSYEVEFEEYDHYCSSMTPQLKKL